MRICIDSRGNVARRSLRPHLNQIRGWVRQGRTDAWIAHQLEVTVQQIEAFKRENELVPDAEPSAALHGGSSGADFDDEIDLRAEDDALIAAELEAAEAARAEEEARRAAEEEERRAAEEAEAEVEAGDDEDEDEDDDEPKKRRRGRRGGRGRKKGAAKELEGTFDHGEEGYGLWLDPAVEDNPVYAEHWAGHRPVTVSIEEDQIVIRRAGDEEVDGDDD
jgi:type IV secretory pathway VirB10-like protein